MISSEKMGRSVTFEAGCRLEGVFTGGTQWLSCVSLCWDLLGWRRNAGRRTLRVLVIFGLHRSIKLIIEFGVGCWLVT